MRKKRGQAGIEYVVLTGLLLFFFIPLIHYAFQETNNAVRNSQLDSYVGRLSKSIDAVHTIGPGAVEIITITVPKGIISATLENTPTVGANEIVLTIAFAGGLSDIHASVKPRIYGTIPSTPGVYQVNVTSTNLTSVTVNYAS